MYLCIFVGGASFDRNGTVCVYKSVCVVNPFLFHFPSSEIPISPSRQLFEFLFQMSFLLGVQFFVLGQFDHGFGPLGILEGGQITNGFNVQGGLGFIRLVRQAFQGRYRGLQQVLQGFRFVFFIDRLINVHETAGGSFRFRRGQDMNRSSQAIILVCGQIPDRGQAHGIQDFFRHGANALQGFQSLVENFRQVTTFIGLDQGFMA